MKKNKLRIIVSLLLLIAIPSFAQKITIQEAAEMAIKNNKDTKTGLPKKDKSNKKESNFNLNKVSLKFTDMNDVTVDKAVDDHNFKLLDDFEKLSQEDELKFNEIMNKNKKSFKDLRKNK